MPIQKLLSSIFIVVSFRSVMLHSQHSGVNTSTYNNNHPRRIKMNSIVQFHYLFSKQKKRSFCYEFKLCTWLLLFIKTVWYRKWFSPKKTNKKKESIEKKQKNKLEKTKVKICQVSVAVGLRKRMIWMFLINIYCLFTVQFEWNFDQI